MSQFSKPNCTPNFDNVKHGSDTARIGADKSNGNAGGEIRSDKLRSNLVKDSTANRK
jgi:hypothetical protein